MAVNKVRKFVNILRVIYISFYLLTFRTRNDTLELIVKETYIAIVFFFFCFGSCIFQSNLILRSNWFKCTNEDVIGKSLEIANSNN